MRVFLSFLNLIRFQNIFFCQINNLYLIFDESIWEFLQVGLAFVHKNSKATVPLPETTISMIFFILSIGTPTGQKKIFFSIFFKKTD